MKLSQLSWFFVCLISITLQVEAQDGPGDHPLDQPGLSLSEDQPEETPNDVSSDDSDEDLDEDLDIDDLLKDLPKRDKQNDEVKSTLSLFFWTQRNDARCEQKVIGNRVEVAKKKKKRMEKR